MPHVVNNTMPHVLTVVVLLLFPLFLVKIAQSIVVIVSSLSVLLARIATIPVVIPVVTVEVEARAAIAVIGAIVGKLA